MKKKPAGLEFGDHPGEIEGLGTHARVNAEGFLGLLVEGIQVIREVTFECFILLADILKCETTLADERIVPLAKFKNEALQNGPVEFGKGLAF